MPGRRVDSATLPVGICAPPDSFLLGRFDGTYTATINGAYQDTGMAGVEAGGSGSVLDSFSEVLTASTDRCKHGGWQSFGTLSKNQEDCVSFVAAGGKNPPSD